MLSICYREVPSPGCVLTQMSSWVGENQICWWALGLTAVLSQFFFPWEHTLQFTLSLLFLWNVLGLDKCGMPAVVQSNTFHCRNGPCLVNSVCKGRLRRHLDFVGLCDKKWIKACWETQTLDSMYGVSWNAMCSLAWISHPQSVIRCGSCHVWGFPILGWLPPTPAALPVTTKDIPMRWKGWEAIPRVL